MIRAGLRLALALLLLGAPSPSEAKKDGKKNTSAQELYEQGLRHMRRGYYTRALEKFNRVRNYHRDDPISVKAQLAIADVHYKKSDYEQARFAYEEFASYHPRHENLDYVTFRIGMSIYKRAPRLAGRDQTATRGAVNAWTGFSSRFPDSRYVVQVDRYLERSRDRLAIKELYIARFYADRDAWGAVRSRCEYMLRRYPDTKHAADGLSLLGESMHRWGASAEAVVVRDQLAADHPDAAPELRHLDRALARAPGVRPDEKVFIRPYRIRGMSPLGGGAVQ